MAETTKTVLSVCTTVDSKLPDLPIQNGQLTLVRDKKYIIFDYDDKRVEYRDIEELTTEEVRKALLAPISGRYYFVLDTCVLWYYSNTWIQVTTSPKDLKAVEDAVKEYADTLSKRVVGSVDADGNFVVMFDESFWS